ncbi:ankyrin repeat protein, putative [Trichomonas vaginalis G3]|uniref:Ankyrin repeat protein, putative n=4 Tax=Trichomonas vaginalis (strain ATCC PRA-98 / G3) TaxID=412133 RepID=A2H8Z7_TRIV3|nr:Ankyrin repeat family [Trichomonas vaginalis G3]EAX74120.1 ankyrin repeat protein, putative [Trichomonas vaginalis G3]KAI5543360.1 Ankyrin repeat family [Trichomonas vaginalis G3]|eukprot:XP_001287050.1 ankyrin repeat protein [Trichomonas vaginalis G3]
MNGSDINSKDNEGKTALHGAAINNNKVMVEYLISHGIKINAADNDGYTTLYYALAFVNKEISELLKSHGAIESAHDLSTERVNIEKEKM